MGWLTASRLASGARGSQEGPRGRVFSTGQAERYLVGRCARKATRGVRPELAEQLLDSAIRGEVDGKRWNPEVRKRQSSSVLFEQTTIDILLLRQVKT